MTSKRAVDERAVYDKDFRENNFGKGSIDGVFTLGQATKEQIEAIKKLLEDLAKIKEKGIKKKASLNDIIARKQLVEDEYRETVWIDIYKTYEAEFKEAFVGVMKKNHSKLEYLTNFTTTQSRVRHMTT